MLKRTPNEYDRLLPYLEGALDESQREQMESRLADNPALAAEADQLRRTVTGLRGAASRLGPAENSEVPATLWPRLRARLDEVPAPQPKPRSQVWWLAGVGATAAAGLTVAAFWLPGWRAPELREMTQVPPAPRVTAPLNPSGSGKKLAVVPPRPAPLRLHPAPVAPTPPPTAIAANKLATTPPHVAAVPAKPTEPDYVIKDPFALPQPPTSFMNSAARSAVRGSTVEEQRRFKVTGNVRLRDSTVNGPSATASNPQEAVTFALRAATPPATSPAPVMQNAVPAMSAQVSTDHALTFNGASAPGGFGGGGFGGGGAAGGANPAQPSQSQTQHGQVQADQAAKTQDALTAPNLKMIRPPTALLSPQRLDRQARKAGPMVLGGSLGQANQDSTEKLEAWQSALSAAVQSPQWGENERVQQANQALMSARMSGMLDDLRNRLEARREQSPQDIVNARMLASVYEFGFLSDAALRERRRITGLDKVVGEDWFALAQAEEKHGNSAAAKTAYRRALESPTPPTPFHAGIARGRI